jgi:EmrB/QacA subfamily drug resistance transporter
MRAASSSFVRWDDANDSEGRLMAADPRRWKALAVLGIAYLMVVLDISVVNVALPAIRSSLHFHSDASLQWIISGYALTFGGLLLLGGRTGDLLGRRRLFMIGLSLFSLFSLLCGLSVSAGMLIAMRLLQGAAGAILAPSVFSITSVTFEQGKERNTALGILGGIAGAGSAIGVLLGGILTQYAGWEWVFIINVPIGLVTLLLVRRYVSESTNAGIAQNFDVAGAITVTASLSLFVFGMTQSPTKGWGSLEVIISLVAAAILMAIFLFIESRSKSPLVPLSFFRKRTPTGANLIGFALGSSIFGMFFLLSLYMENVLGMSPIKTGVGYLAIALTSVGAAGVAQALVTKLGVKPVLSTGMLLLAGGLFYLTQISADGSYWHDLFIPYLMLGLALGFSFVPISIAALGGIQPSEAGLASGLINTSQQIGGALGLAILATVATTRIRHLTPPGAKFPPKTALTSGYSLAFWVSAGLAVGGLVLTWFALKKDELAVDTGAVQPAG